MTNINFILRRMEYGRPSRLEVSRRKGVTTADRDLNAGLTWQIQPRDEEIIGEG